MGCILSAGEEGTAVTNAFALWNNADPAYERAVAAGCKVNLWSLGDQFLGTVRHA